MSDQPGLFDDPEPEPKAETPTTPPDKATIRRQYLDQIIRDTAVLREDATCHSPSLEFYQERIASFRQAILELDLGVNSDEP